jgi:hypothetical protein
MPTTGPRLPLARPHPAGKNLAKRSGQEAMPLLLKLFNRQTIRKSQKENTDVIFSSEFDEQTNVLLRNEFGCVAAVALVLS